MIGNGCGPHEPIWHTCKLSHCKQSRTILSRYINTLTVLNTVSHRSCSAVAQKHCFGKHCLYTPDCTTLYWFSKQCQRLRISDECRTRTDARSNVHCTPRFHMKTSTRGFSKARRRTALRPSDGRVESFTPLQLLEPWSTICRNSILLRLRCGVKKVSLTLG